MPEGPSNFEGQNENNNFDPEQTKLRIDEIRYELMQIERQVMQLKKHPSTDSEEEIKRLHERQKEILDELQRLVDTK